MAKTFEADKGQRSPTPVFEAKAVAKALNAGTASKGIRMLDTLSLTYEPPFEHVLHDLNVPRASLF